MPLPIPEGKQITVEKNLRSGKYAMPSMEISTDHYDIGFTVSGRRKVLTLNESYTYGSGDVCLGTPYVYHRTVPQSDEPYENYLIKFTPRFIEPFINNVGKNIFNELYSRRVCRFSAEMQPKIKNMFSEALEEYNKNTPYKEFILQGIISRLLTTIYESRLNCGITKYKSSLTEPVLEAIYYIENNFDKDLRLEEAAKQSHFSPSYFSRLFASQLGISFSEYLSGVRIKHVKDLLIKTDKSITEIAAETGYCNGDYLSAQFKRKTGITPSRFRQNSKNKA